MMTFKLTLGYDTCAYAAYHNALQKFPSREIDDFDVILFQIYRRIANNYFNTQRFGKVIAKIKWCSFFSPHSVNAWRRRPYNAERLPSMQAAYARTCQQ